MVRELTQPQGLELSIGSRVTHSKKPEGLQWPRWADYSITDWGLWVVGFPRGLAFTWVGYQSFQSGFGMAPRYLANQDWTPGAQQGENKALPRAELPIGPVS